MQNIYISGTKQPELALMQIATEENVYILDVTTIGNKLSELWNELGLILFGNKDIVKIGMYFQLPKILLSVFYLYTYTYLIIYILFILKIDNYLVFFNDNIISNICVMKTTQMFDIKIIIYRVFPVRDKFKRVINLIKQNFY